MHEYNLASSCASYFQSVLLLLCRTLISDSRNYLPNHHLTFIIHGPRYNQDVSGISGSTEENLIVASGYPIQLTRTIITLFRTSPSRIIPPHRSTQHSPLSTPRLPPSALQTLSRCLPLHLPLLPKSAAASNPPPPYPLTPPPTSPTPPPTSPANSTASAAPRSNPGPPPARAPPHATAPPTPSPARTPTAPSPRATASTCSGTYATTTSAIGRCRAMCAGRRAGIWVCAIIGRSILQARTRRSWRR
ncbi:hypothetical protein P152DRAFT_68121 [Eremomyces bilateralis CBS 781.70]|uniref:Uncharacterized protein n=1 Tax=Eremomyces bilateralis CBS 781.70 TaxID=1392243 RepID=A0A6G1FZS2_9PEZI|nr:uncharacterized protein P152DRAFT_68121 [Eremomyces bilateralis CBS 781.70]KAF1811293.1 hypothetical protein P152DRAFT_68121 [Eremomyces bilateralis CBS 781.70]